MKYHVISDRVYKLLLVDMFPLLFKMTFSMQFCVCELQIRVNKFFILGQCLLLKCNIIGGRNSIYKDVMCSSGTGLPLLCSATVMNDNH